MIDILFPKLHKEGYKFLAIAAVISVLPVVAIDPIFNTIVPRGQIPELLILGIALVLAQAIGGASQMLASVRCYKQLLTHAYSEAIQQT